MVLGHKHFDICDVMERQCSVCKKIQHKYNDRWLDGKAPDSITLKELQ